MVWLHIIDVILAAGATARLTRAITAEEIGARLLRDPAEEWATRATGPQRRRRDFWADALYCPYCVSTWIAIAAAGILTIAWALDAGWLYAYRIVAGGLTISMVVAPIVAATTSDDEPEEYDEPQANQGHTAE